MSDEHNKTSSSDESFVRVAIPYDEFEIMLKDINEEELVNIGVAEGIAHLSEGTFSSPPFPVNGTIHGPNSRFMVPLVVQRTGKLNSKAINVWFLLDTGSPFTTLTVKSLEALFGQGNVATGQYYPMAIQDPNIRIECQVSKVGSNFEFVNILGADAMRDLELSAIEGINWRQKTFCLARQ